MSKRYLYVGGLKYEIIEKHAATDDGFICDVDNDHSEIHVSKNMSKGQYQASFLECAITIILSQIGYYKFQKDRKFAASLTTVYRQYLQDNNIFKKIKQLNLCGSMYAVRYRDNRKMPDAYGEINVAKTEILMANYLKNDARALTFLHEMTHSIMHQLGQDKLYGDERFISSFSFVLFSVIKDNKKLLFG